VCDRKQANQDQKKADPTVQAGAFFTLEEVSEVDRGRLLEEEELSDSRSDEPFWRKPNRR